MSEDERVRLHVDAEGVATVTLTRAAKHNALDGAMFLAIDGVLAQLADDASVRAVVLHGEGPSFCSGLDVASFFSGDSPLSMEDLTDREAGGLTNLAQRVAYGWSALPVPVVAAIQGNCFGGGLQIALGPDIRIAAPDAKLCVMEVKWGLVPDMAITHTLPRLVSVDVAKELTYTGRIVSGEQAAALGLVTRTAADPLAAALELAAEIAAKSPDAVRAAKRLYETHWPAPDTLSAFELETDLQVALIGSPNQQEAVRAGIAKEPATFADPSVAVS